MHLNRHIHMDGAVNMRDLGGLRTKDGRTIRRGKWYRSDSLHRLPHQAQQQIIMHLGIRKIIDLRRPDELIREPHVLAEHPQIEYHNIALRLVPFPENQDAEVGFTLTDLYRGIIKSNADLLNDVFQHLISDDQPVVFHCKAGKDRTGIVAAILLDALGVSHEDIEADYALTEANIRSMIPELMAERPDSIPEKQYAALLETHPHAIRHVLSVLEKEHGGALGFLHHAGIVKQNWQRLKDKYLE